MSPSAQIWNRSPCQQLRPCLGTPKRKSRSSGSHVTYTPIKN